MQAARLTQDHYGLIRQHSVYRQQTEVDQTRAKHSRSTVLPAERVVEGEVLSKRSSTTGDSLDQLLQRSRFVNSAANASDVTLTTQGAQRAINAYLDNSAGSGSSAGRSGSIDYYA